MPTTGWTDFRAALGARLDTDDVASFGDPAAELAAARDSAALCDLGASGVLSLAGPDAATFLQGQVTNDVEALSPGTWQFAAWCSAKGRVLVVFALHRTRLDAFELMLPGTMLAAIRKRLAMFVLRAKVVIEDASAANVRFGIGGPAAADRLRTALGALPGPHEVARIGEASVRALPGGRFMLGAPTTAAIELWSQLSGHARPAGEPAWRWLRVRGGVPRIVAATSDQFVPQALNLDALDGVSFRKGCYAGQEIVARTQYLGRLKERLVLARVRGSPPPTPGERLYSPAFEAQPCGTVIEAAHAPRTDGEDGSDLLAVLHTAAREHGDVRLGDPSGPPLELLALPYAIPVAAPPRGRIA
ncbi:MAG: folate-binding protein [Betaproteobacteria bacterium]